MKKLLSILMIALALVLMMFIITSCSCGGGEEPDDQGRAILKTEIIDGYLWVTYVDAPNEPVNLGKVVDDSAIHGTKGLAFVQLDDGTYGVHCGNANDEATIEIPATYNNKTVSTILSQGFQDCSNLKSVVIASSITNIGSDAFKGCPIEEATAPSCAFKELSKDKLKKIVVNGGKSFDDEAFAGSKIIESAVFLNGVQSIGTFAFADCSNLSSVIIPTTVTYVGFGSFYNCTGLTIYCESRNQPIDWDTEWNFSKRPVIWALNNITSNSEYDYVCFNGKAYLTRYKGRNADVEIPKAIDNNTVVYFGEAFTQNQSITSVSIPSTITYIADSAFMECTALASITVDTSNEYYKSINDILYDGNEKTIIQYPLGKSEASLEIPSSVTDFGKYAFKGSSKLASVIIPNGVTVIEDSLFLNCTALTSIKIPSNVTAIKENAFRGCHALSRVEIPSSVTAIGRYSFYDCSIKEVNIPSIAIPSIKNTELESVIINSGTNIESFAFDGCSKLTSVEIPSSITNIGISVFRGCSSLTSVVISGNVVIVGDDAFKGCSALTIYCEATSQPSGWYSNWNSTNCPVVWGHNNITTNSDYDYVVHGNEALLTRFKGTSANVTIPEIIDGYTVVSFGEIFRGNTNITSIVIPNSVTSISRCAFKACSSLESVEISSNAVSIGAEAFKECKALKSAIIPNGVQSVGDEAFSGCSALTSVEISSSVSSIGKQAFYGCSSLASISVDQNNKQYKSIDGSLYNAGEKRLIQYAIGKTDTSFKIPSTVTIINDYAFYGCANLTSIEIPNSVTSIGTCAFFDCSGLTSIEIPSSVKSIANYTFRGCSSLQSVVIPSSVTSIGWEAFRDCSKLTSVVIPSGVTTMGWRVFVGCSSLTIRCEAESQPSDWNARWNSSSCPVEWGYKK